MSNLPGFRQLQNFIGEQTARKPRKSSGPKTETANELTRRIIKHVRANGGFATHLASTGIYRADLNKFVSSQQISGLPNVFAVVKGCAVFVEVKIGEDRLSMVQKQTIAALQKVGANVYVTSDFESFSNWFTALLQILTKDDGLPLGPSFPDQH